MPRHRLDVTRFFGVLSEGPPELAYGVLHRAYLAVPTPDPLQKLSPSRRRAPDS